MVCDLVEVSRAVAPADTRFFLPGSPAAVRTSAKDKQDRDSCPARRGRTKRGNLEWVTHARPGRKRRVIRLAHADGNKTGTRV